MRAELVRLWALTGMALLTVSGASQGASPQGDAAPVSPGLAAEEREGCTRNLKIIYDAIQAYQFDHKDLPNWLSDLVPDYISDPRVLICPVCRRTGRTETAPLADPKLACSYIFEFSPVPVGPTLPGEPNHSRREWRRRQMGLVGSGVPMVRCRHHSPLLNLGFNGTVYQSPAQWELIFTNRVRPAELTVAAIFGGSPSPEEEQPSKTASTGEVVQREPTPGFHPIDLSRFYTCNLEEAWLGKAGDDLAALPKGTQSFGGIEFDVQGVVQLRGPSGGLAKYPDKIKGIPVHQRCQHLYFLHAASAGGNANEGEQIGAYVVHLPNNQMNLEIPIFYGRAVRNWHEVPDEPKPDKELKVVWTGENTASKQNGKAIRLFVTTWNLAPGVDIDSLDFVSAGHSATPFLLAISTD